MFRGFFRSVRELPGPFPIVVVLAALCVASIFVIMSATFTNDALKDAYSSQFKYVLIGFVVYFALALTSYTTLTRLEISMILYAAGIALLVACFVPHVGKKVFGAYSWIHIGPIGFEPAEFAKLTFIIFLAAFLNNPWIPWFRFSGWVPVPYLRALHVKSIVVVLLAVFITAIPFALVAKEPALGGASVFFPVCFCMLFAAGARLWYLIPPLIVVVGGATLAYYWIHVWQKPVPYLKDYQLHRIQVFFDPSMDKQGSSWAINQSLIAVGMGGMDGMGWRQGTETVLGYLPKNTSYNDLIFPVLAEDFGFRGGALLIICEGIVLLWCLVVAGNTRDKVGSLLAVGVMAMLFTHDFVNIGMTIQVVPITGIPLPFISYGGTFLVACLAAMGLVQSVWVHRYKFERA